MNTIRRVLSCLLPLALIPLTVILFSGFMSQKTSAEQLSLVETAVRRAAVECYATEGFYPPDLSYLTEYYGLATDSTRYFIDYQYIAANLVPDITVIARSD
ncbi:MAG: hypothetical protein H6Q60_1097 [Oscillospiraceae bacterium]|nr:hypothetical protein [Oscillospiraceae bacterium]